MQETDTTYLNILVDGFQHIIHGKCSDGCAMHGLNFHPSFVDRGYFHFDMNRQPVDCMTDSGMLDWQWMTIRNYIAGLFNGQ